MVTKVAWHVCSWFTIAGRDDEMLILALDVNDQIASAYFKSAHLNTPTLRTPG